MRKKYKNYKKATEESLSKILEEYISAMNTRKLEGIPYDSIITQIIKIQHQIIYLKKGKK